MRLTIIQSDGTVIHDDLAYTELDLGNCGVPSNIHALQWCDGHGEIEFTDGKKNEKIESLPSWADACLNVWDKANEEAHKEPDPPTPEEVAEDNKGRAKSLLQQTDWVELADVDDPNDPPFLTNKADYRSYRAALREIAINPPQTEIDFPKKPQAVWSDG